MPTLGQAAGIGQRIAEARTGAGLTQRALAKGVGVAERTIQSWELNERHPRLQALHAIADFTGQPLSWFFEDGALA